MYCTNCNQEIPDDSVFCPLCGAKIQPRRDAYNGGYQRKETFDGYGQPQNRYYQPPQPQFTEDTIPEEWKPITMWGYFGYELLFCIPIVGLILLLVFSFGGTRNRNLRNFARSYFCLLIIVAVIVAIILIAAAGGAGFGAVSNRYS